MSWLSIQAATDLRPSFVRNLQIAYHSATMAEFDEGHQWYEVNSLLCRQAAKELQIDSNSFCKIVAIVSPAVPWGENISVAKEVVEGRNTVITTANYTKARKAMIGDCDISPKTAAKTYNFYNNLIAPSDPSFVTIDRHAIRACLGASNMQAYKGAIGVDYKTYNMLAETYFELASHYGVLANQVQAVTWLYAKRIYGKGRAK